MQDEYLPIGYRIGGHYEIIKFLGNDEFEIVYVVKDIHRLETLFVLKELFLKEYSFREEENEVYIFEKSKSSFEKTKKNVISEVNLFKERGSTNSIQTYGYFEENNTIYTIMEFVNSAELSNYLKVTPKKIETKIEPKVNMEIEPKKEDEDKEEKKPKSYLFLKMLIISIVLFIGLGIYAYNMIKEDKNRPKESTVAIVTQKTIIPHPELTDRTQKEESKKEDNKSDISKSKVTDATRYIPPEEKIEKIEIDVGIPAEEIIEVEELTPTIPHKKNIEVVFVPPKAESTDISIGDRITNTDHSGPKFNRENIKKFLESFISSAEENSIDRIVSHYDNHVEQYFSIKGATHKNIYRDKVQYNKKWVQRDFQLLDFEILNISKIDGVEYCDIKKRTRWSVSTSYGKNASGTSRVFMVLKRTSSGFKVKSIYSF